MSTNTQTIVMIGKNVKHSDFTEDMFEQLMGEEHDPIVYRFNDFADTGCLGIVLGESLHYNDEGYGDMDMMLIDTIGDFDKLVTDVFIEINNIGLKCNRNEVKLYFRDNWT